MLVHYLEICQNLIIFNYNSITHNNDPNLLFYCIYIPNVPKKIIKKKYTLVRIELFLCTKILQNVVCIKLI